MIVFFMVQVFKAPRCTSGRLASYFLTETARDTPTKASKKTKNNSAAPKAGPPKFNLFSSVGPNPVFGKPGVVEETVKRIALEVPPPGAGLTTSTANFPATERSEAGIATFNWVLETNVAGRLMPLNLTA